jgi:hypothetical protein
MMMATEQDFVCLSGVSLISYRQTEVSFTENFSLRRDCYNNGII